MANIEIMRGDITRVAADAIVNAANSQLMRGGGVCGAIHAAGGPSIAQECREYVATHGPVLPGSAAATTAGELPARYVIHAVGPMWQGGSAGEVETLASAYRSALEVAEGLDCKSIAFPSISTGIYGFPLGLAVPIAIKTAREWVTGGESAGELGVADANAAESGDATGRTLQRVILVLFDERTHEAFREALDS